MDTVQIYWRLYIEPYSDWTLLTFGMAIVLFVSNFVGAFVFTMFDVFGLFTKYRLVWTPGTQDNRPGTLKEIKECIVCFLINFVFFLFPALFVGAYVLQLRGFSIRDPLPTFGTIMWQLPFFAIMEDASGYWIHRWMHTPWAFKHIHKKHHRFNTPFALSNVYMHPGEMVNMGMAVVTGPLLIGPHLFTHWVWVFYRIVDSFAQHSGYEFPWDPRAIIFGMEQPRLHDSHHLFVKANYGFNFSMWDKLFGTFRPLDKAVTVGGQKYAAS